MLTVAYSIVEHSLKLLSPIPSRHILFLINKEKKKTVLDKEKEVHLC